MSAEVSYENGTLIVTRYFAAPRPAVFEAWIQTSKVELWWGCGYATEVKSEIEPKVGGRYHHSMLLEGAGEYQHHGLITEYEPPALLAYEFVDPVSKQKMDVRVAFSEEEGGTTVRLTQRNLLDEHSQYVRAGWSSSLAALAFFLETGGQPRRRPVEG